MGDGRMSGHVEERLSDYLEGDLAPSGEERVRAHLRACAACRAALAELRDVVRRAGSLQDSPPERDLWPGIVARIEGRDTGSEPEGDAADHRTISARGSDGGRRAPGRTTASPWQRKVAVPVRTLAAAAALLLAVSLGAGWTLGRATGDTSPAEGRGVAASAGTEQAGGVGGARTAAMESSYAEAIAELESELAERRDRLAPATRGALRSSLASIDTAIAEARSALARDDADPGLSRYLSNTYRRKVEVLKVALELTSGD